MNLFSQYSKKSAHHGFSMVELLVAVVVLAVGLLGMLSLQTAGFMMNKTNLYRSQANMLTQDMAERMRTSVNLATTANKAIQRNAYAVIGTPFNTQNDPPDDPGCITSNAGCSLTDLATTDLLQWRAAVRTLPAGSGTIIRDAATGVFTITISWIDSTLNRKTADRLAKSTSLSLDLGS